MKFEYLSSVCTIVLLCLVIGFGLFGFVDHSVHAAQRTAGTSLEEQQLDEMQKQTRALEKISKSLEELASHR